MVQGTPNAGRRRPGVPRGLLGMMLLVAVVEGLFGKFGRLADPVGVEWRFGDLAARRKAPRADLLLFGDSLIRCGVDAGVLEARLGRTACNLALTACPPSAIDFVLRHALAAGARPEAVVVDFAPHLMDCGPEFTAPLLPELADLCDGLDLARTARDAGLFARLALARWLPSVRDRASIRPALLAAIRGEPFRRPGADPKLVARMIYPEAWSCRALNRHYVERFLARARSHGLRVFWLVPPYRPDAFAARQSRGLEAAYTRFVWEIHALHPEVVVIDGRRLALDADLFNDPAHLGRRGAVAFTGAVAEVLRPYLDGPSEGPRWVEMAPAPRSIALRVDPEDPQSTPECRIIIGVGPTSVGPELRESKGVPVRLKSDLPIINR